MILRTLPCLLFALSAVAAEKAAWEWQVDDTNKVELRGKAGPVARLLVDPAPIDSHFDLLATPDGRNLVGVAPPDHVWHYGLWFSWKFINDVNFWETDRKTGASAGIVKVLDPVIKTGGDTATIRYQRDYRLPGGDAPIMKDLVEIVIHVPRGKFGPQVDWAFTTTALADVELGRTPLPGEPGGAGHGGYGGLAWRGAKGLTDVQFLDSEGRRDMDMHRSHARWADARGTLAGKPAGIAILDHPQNPDHPASWFIVSTPKQPFWYLNPALVQPKPLKLAKGESFHYRYRVLPHDGTLTDEEINAEAKLFGK